MSACNDQKMRNTATSFAKKPILIDKNILLKQAGDKPFLNFKQQETLRVENGSP